MSSDTEQATLGELDEESTNAVADIGGNRVPRADERLGNETWLREQFAVRGRSKRDIADELGCTRDTVNRWLNKLGLKDARSEVTPGHLQEHKPPNNASRLEATKDREYWCGECNQRVTVSPHESREYGHTRDCEYKIQWDKSGGRGREQ
jgi:transposase